MSHTNNSISAVHTIHFQEGHFHVIFCPELELITSSETKDKVNRSFENMVLAYADYSSKNDFGNDNPGMDFVLNNLNTKKITKNRFNDFSKTYTFLNRAENIEFNNFPINLAVES